MIQKVMKKRDLQDAEGRDDLAFWLTRPPDERVGAVEILRRQYYGSTPRLAG